MEEAVRQQKRCDGIHEIDKTASLRSPQTACRLAYIAPLSYNCSLFACLVFTHPRFNALLIEVRPTTALLHSHT